MIIIIGKTASGKDTILKNLVEKHGYKKIVTYTTRPMRRGERQGVSYNFISEDDFKKKINKGFFAEWKTYDTEFGIWYYGTALEDLERADQRNVIILTPGGYRDIINKLSTKTKAIYIYADNSTIMQRLIKRGDDKDEAKRRLEHDNIDFKGIEDDVNYVFYNNINDNIDNVVENIVDWLESCDTY